MELIYIFKPFFGHFNFVVPLCHLEDVIFYYKQIVPENLQLFSKQTNFGTFPKGGGVKAQSKEKRALFATVRFPLESLSSYLTDP